MTVTKSEFTRASVVAAFGAWVGFITGPNAMIAATNSNFMAILPDALGTSRTFISTALAVSLWMNALFVPFGGRLMDRYGVRAVILPGIVLFGGNFLLLSVMRLPWHFFALQMLMAVPVSMHCSVAYAKLISLWFDRNRGLVLGLCVSLGAGLSQTAMPKISRALIDEYGWRGGYVGIALIILLIGLPIVTLLAHTPKSLAERDQKRRAAEVRNVTDEGVEGSVPPVAPLGQIGVTRAEALRQPVFYQVFAAIMFGSMALLGTMQHAIPMLTERGLGIGTATTVMSCVFAGVVLGEFSSGFLVDRINTPRIILPYFVSALIGVLIVHTATDPWILLPGAVMMGLGLGGEIGQNAYLVSRYFGLKSFGSIYGLTFAASAIGNGTCLILLGVIRDTFGSYVPGRYLVGTAMTISVLCIATLKPFVYASPRSAVH
jgi:MFS family permease